MREVGSHLCDRTLDKAQALAAFETFMSSPGCPTGWVRPTCQRGRSARLDELASTKLDPEPAPLGDVLQGHEHAQWLIIDCTGSPWMEALQESIVQLFDDLRRLVAAELEIAARRVVRCLDPSLPLVIFADHGFRLAPDGKSYRHGGPSTLERLVPVLAFAPY